MRAPHSSHNCIWKKWIRPLFIIEHGPFCDRPEQLDNEMKKVLEDFVFDNLDEFQEWLEYNSKSEPQSGTVKWNEYLKENVYGCPHLGPLPILLPYIVAVVGGVLFATYFI